MRVWSEKRKSCEGISAEMWFWVGRALNGLMFLYGLYCWETRLLFWICCLSIAVKPWNSCIFKLPSCLVNKPWMLRGLDWSRIKRGCEHRGTSECVFRKCHWMLHYSDVLNNHATSGKPLPERMKDRFLSLDIRACMHMCNRETRQLSFRESIFCPWK